MVAGELLLILYTRHHVYAARRDQVLELRRITGADDLARPDNRGKPLISADLAQLLDPADSCPPLTGHALIIPARRRGVALLVERVDDLYATKPDLVQPLAPLLARRLARPWVRATLIFDNRPVLVLDVRQIAQDILLQSAAVPQTPPPAVAQNQPVSQADAVVAAG